MIANIEIYKDKNMFDFGYQTLVNPCNTVGVAGKGLSKIFKEKFPSSYKEYKSFVKLGALRTGSPCASYIFDNRIILHFPTKEDWKNDSKLEYIESGLKYLAKNYQPIGIQSIAIPALGCGLGKLEIRDVFRMMLYYLCDLKIDIGIFLSSDQLEKIRDIISTEIKIYE